MNVIAKIHGRIRRWNGAFCMRVFNHVFSFYASLTEDPPERMIGCMMEAGPRVRRAAPWIIAIVATAGVAFFAGVTFGKGDVPLASASTTSTSAIASVEGVGSNPPSDLGVPPTFKEFWDLWRSIEDRYYQQPVDEQKMLYGAMSGLASSVDDPYTLFFPPKNAEAFNQNLQGKFEGIGAEIGIKNDQLQIIAPLPDSPAEKAGLKAGDLILKIDATSTDAMSIDQAVTLIRGDKGTTVTLTIGRYTTTKDASGKEKQTPETKDIPIVRDVIKVKSVNVKYVEKDTIAVISVSNFNADTEDLFNQAVTDALAKNVKGVVLDLRNDPGGYLDKAISMASEWVGDQVVVKERRQGKIVDEYKGDHPARLKDMPTVVLVNGGSASASEIVSGALQDYAKATLVGTKTFGKGSVQDYTEFPDKSALKITIAEWVTPKERSINKQGLDPDITVDRTEEDYNANRDPQLDKAIELLTGKATAPSASASESGGAASSTN